MARRRKNDWVPYAVVGGLGAAAVAVWWFWQQQQINAGAGATTAPPVTGTVTVGPITTVPPDQQTSS